MKQAGGKRTTKKEKLVSGTSRKGRNYVPPTFNIKGVPEPQDFLTPKGKEIYFEITNG